MTALLYSHMSSARRTSSKARASEPQMQRNEAYANIAVRSDEEGLEMKPNSAYGTHHVSQTVPDLQTDIPASSHGDNHQNTDSTYETMP